MTKEQKREKDRHFVEADCELGDYLMNLMQVHNISYDELMYLTSKHLHSLLNTHIKNQ